MVKYGGQDKREEFNGDGRQNNVLRRRKMVQNVTVILHCIAMQNGCFEVQGKCQEERVTCN